MSYNIDDFVAEFKGTYDAAIYKAKALNIQDIYISTYAYVVDSQTRYAFFRFPDAGGLAYWTNLALTNNWDLSSQDLLRAIFAAGDAVPEYYTRARTAVKALAGDVAFLDRSYGIDGFVNEFLPQYNLDAARFKDRAFTIAWAVYLSGYEWTLSDGSKRYGLRRLPDASGLAYWTSQYIIYNATDQQLIDAFFGAVASAGGTEASRALTSNKSFEGSIAFSDRTGANYSNKYGLKVWAQDGTIRLDTTDRLLRLHSQVAFSHPSAPMYTYQTIYNFWLPQNYTLNVSIPGIRDDNTWHAHVSIGRYWRVRYIFNDYVQLFATLQYPYGFESIGYTSHYASSNGQITVYRV